MRQSQAIAEKPDTNQADPFYSAFKGAFQGILRWPQLDALWDTITQNEQDWYIYPVGEKPPEKPVDKKALKHFIKQIDGLLRREHDEEYCGIVYTDNLQEPTYIKIFDPNNIGTSCSIAKNPPLPGWILSVLKPIDLPAAMMQQMHQTKNRKRWWNRLFA